MKKVIAVLLLSLLATSLFAVSYEARYGICYGQKYEYNYPFTQYSHDWDVKQGLYQNVGLDAFLGKGFLQIGASADAGFLYAWHKQHLTNNGASLEKRRELHLFWPTDCRWPIPKNEHLGPQFHARSSRIQHGAAVLHEMWSENRKGQRECSLVHFHHPGARGLGIRQVQSRDNAFLHGLWVIWSLLFLILSLHHFRRSSSWMTEHLLPSSR